HGAFGALLFAAPASHCSPFAVSTIELPQVSFDLQSLEQPSPETVLPSSQTSPLVLSSTPSPQRCGAQFVRQVAFGAFEFAAPRSQISPNRVSTIASPHFWSKQDVRQVAFGLFEFAEPLSHCSPLTLSMIPLPQTSRDRQ